MRWLIGVAWFKAYSQCIVYLCDLDVIKCADWVIDLGPEGGDGGGYIVAQGPPEGVALCRESYTGQFLNEVL